MESYLSTDHYDLVTPDGKITQLKPLASGNVEAVVTIEGISPPFVGFEIDPAHVGFNFKSTLAQLGVNATDKEILLNPKGQRAEVKIELSGIGPIAKAMLPHIQEGSYVGKLFAADPRRRVRNPEYLLRMFGRTDRYGSPLLSLGQSHGSDPLLLEKIDGRTVAYLSLQAGTLTYSLDAILGLLPTIGKGLLIPNFRLRSLVQLNQIWQPGAKRIPKKEELLLVRTAPLHIRTAFGKVVDALLPKGIQHTAASVLEPDTEASGDVYELYGSCSQEIEEIPIEFYTLEPHREHVFFSDRDQLQTALEDPKVLFHAFETAPKPDNLRAAVYIVKGEQLLHLAPKDWIARETRMDIFPGLSHPGRQTFLVDKYIQQQPSFPFLKGIEEGLITSQGILLSRHFPSPVMKRMLLSNAVQKCLKGLYFLLPSLHHGDYFSHEDRALLIDLAKFAIPVYWVDKTSGKVLQYLPKPGKDAGMFVPEDKVDVYLTSTAFGIYGSNLLPGPFEQELIKLLRGIQALALESDHPLLNKNTPLALVTGGGPGVMEMGNRVAQELGILSCANIVDFRLKPESVVREQEQNPYIDAKMTYRLDKLVERQAEFNLDFPIFLTGGIGTDFEFALEEVRRKVGAAAPHPVLLFGSRDYWHSKITSRFKCNLASGTIRGSEWVSNCFFCIQTAEQGLALYRRFFSGNLPIGKHAPIAPEGFL